MEDRSAWTDFDDAGLKSQWPSDTRNCDIVKEFVPAILQSPLSIFDQSMFLTGGHFVFRGIVFISHCKDKEQK